MKHTPGPWKADEGSISAHDKTWLVAEVDCSDRYDADGLALMEANARLIAAAPEMLAALKHVYEAITSDKPVDYDVVRDAIVKAKGGTL